MSNDKMIADWFFEAANKSLCRRDHDDLAFVGEFGKAAEDRRQREVAEAEAEAEAQAQAQARRDAAWDSVLKAIAERGDSEDESSDVPELRSEP